MPNNASTTPTLGRQTALLISALAAREQEAFDLADVRDITGLSDVSARSFARKLVNRGVATRIGAGRYLRVPLDLGGPRAFLGNPLVIADALAGRLPHFLSHGTAMELHGMRTQPQLDVVVTASKFIRSREVAATRYVFVHRDEADIFGLTDHWVTPQRRISVSDIERTIIDGLRTPALCGGLVDVARGLWMKRRDVDVERLMGYAASLGVGAIQRRLGFLLELYRIGSREQWDRLSRSLTTYYAPLDPDLPADGRLTNRWRVNVNVTEDELLAAVET